jgi:hypothetical protein
LKDSELIENISWDSWLGVHPRIAPDKRSTVDANGARLWQSPAAALTLFPSHCVPATCCGWALPQPRSTATRPDQAAVSRCTLKEYANCSVARYANLQFARLWQTKWAIRFDFNIKYLAFKRLG